MESMLQAAMRLLGQTAWKRLTRGGQKARSSQSQPCCPMLPHVLSSIHGRNTSPPMQILSPYSLIIFSGLGVYVAYVNTLSSGPQPSPRLMGILHNLLPASPQC